MIDSKSLIPPQDTNLTADKRVIDYRNIRTSQILCRCVAEDTLVTMADGTERKIQDIRLGENVMGRRYEMNMVIDIIVGCEQAPYCLCLTNDICLIATGTHPVLTDNGWKIMRDLTAEDIVQTLAQGGQPISSIEIYTFGNDSNRNYMKPYGLGLKNKTSVKTYGLIISANADEHAIVCNGIIVGDYIMENTMQMK